MRSEAEVRAFTGNGIRLLIERSVPHDCDPALTDSVFAEFKRIYSEHNLDKTAPYPGVPTMLDELKGHGIATAVASNKADFAVQAIVAKLLPGTIDAVYGERQGMRTKPERDMVDAIVTELGLEDARVAYVGDSEIDAKTAEGAGLDCILCTWGFRDREFLASFCPKALVDTPEELLAQLLG